MLIQQSVTLISREGDMPAKTIECPKCGSDAKAYGRVSCWCDKDFCNGQRCGADELAEDYECACGSSGTTPEAEAYYARHMPKD
jgi:hypothetical protein